MGDFTREGSGSLKTDVNNKIWIQMWQFCGFDLDFSEEQVLIDGFLTSEKENKTDVEEAVIHGWGRDKHVWAV